MARNTLADETEEMWESCDSDNDMLDSDYDLKETRGISGIAKSGFKKRYKSYKQKYRVAWEKDEQFKNWLQPIRNNPDKAYCKLCSKQLIATKTTLRKHKQTASHKVKEEALYGSIKQPTVDSMLVSKTQEKLVQEAEIMMAMFLAEHNIPFHVMDHLTELVSQMFPDSPTALRFKSKRTKTKCIVTNACSPFFHQALVTQLKAKHFSVIIDETTDISTTKELAIVCRYYDNFEQKVVSQFYEMIPTVSATAESIYTHLVDTFAKDEIPLTNILGFASDTTNSMFGEHNSVVSRLRSANPNIYFMRCICHTAHLCASSACEKLPRTLEELLRDIYNYFAHSSKRQSQYSVVQKFEDVEPHKILRPCQTRWLSVQSCVARVLEQWDALLAYFRIVSQTDNLLVSDKILSHLQNPVWKLYMLFLNFVLRKFTDLNLAFQSASTTIHVLHKKIDCVYKEILSCYMVEASWRHVPDVSQIDPSSRTHFLPLNSMYMGAQVALLLSDMMKDRSHQSEVHHFLSRVQEFYIESALQIKRRFPLGDPILKMLQVLDPNTPLSTFPSLAPLVSRFSFLIPDSDLETLDVEWRRLSMAVELPFNKDSMDPEKFWSQLDDVTDGLGNSQFSTLSKFMKTLLCMPTSNVDVERIFSDLNNIKTKLRNKLHSSTVSALLTCKHTIKRSYGSCFKFRPPPEIRQRMQASVLYQEQCVDSESENNDSDKDTVTE